MAITSTYTHTDGVPRMAVGRFLDTGTTADTAFTLGFKPRVVRWHNLTDRISDEWFEGMAALSAIHTVAAGTRTLSVSLGPTVNAGSATVGAGFTMPVASVITTKQYSWEAYE